MDNLAYHPLANLFPLIEGEQFDALVGDIREHGLQDQIDLFQGKILDGRNRYRAAKEAGIELTSRNFRRFHPEFYGDPLAYVISKNLTRRHLDDSQRAMVAARLATMRQGERTDRPEPSANLPKVDQPTAAKALSISERALRHARGVQEHGVPELTRAVDRGRLAVSVADKASRLAPDIQRRIAAEAEAGNAAAARSAVKAARRDERLEELANAEGPLKAKGVYNVVYADPPWQFEPYSRETGMDRAADNHYPCASTQQICEMPVPAITAKNCVLFLWATVPMLPDAFAVMAAWGFTYKSHCIWNKDQAGTGYWFRNKHELLLVGVKGQIPAPLPGTQFQSVLDAPVKDHSRKPLIFRGMIEGLFPNLPKIELFARTPAKGWGQWGKEAPEPIIDPSDEQPMTAEEKRQASLLGQHMDEMEAETPPTSQHLPKHDPETGEIEDDGLAIPSFLRREVA